MQIAEEALSLIDVDYEAFPVVFESLEALKRGAPTVHDDPTSYVGAYVNDAAPDLSNICSFVHISRADVDGAMQRAEQVIEHTFTT